MSFIFGDIAVLRDMPYSKDLNQIPFVWKVRGMRRKWALTPMSVCLIKHQSISEFRFLFSVDSDGLCLFYDRKSCVLSLLVAHSLIKKIKISCN